MGNITESVIRIMGKGLEFSRRALLNLWIFLKINGINGKSENIPIILFKTPKITGEIFAKNNVTCEILFRSDSLANKRLMSEDVQVFVNKNDWSIK